MGLQEETGGRLLVVFDGHCGLCDHVVRWLLKRDRGDKMRFSPQTHPAVRDLLQQRGVTALPETVLVIESAGTPAERVFDRSDAVLRCLKELGGPWSLLATIGSWLPRGLRDWAYRVVARNRYRIWGRRAECRIPQAGEREHFLPELP